MDTVRTRGLVFLVLFYVGVASALVWLVIGFLPAAAAASGSIHSWLHRVGDGEGLFDQLGRNAAQSAHGTATAAQIVLDYVFSVFNLGLAVILIKLRPHDATARLLSFGMIGSAIAFNLQGHDALAVVPVALLGGVETWHVGVHVLSGLSYTFALLMFPSGRLLTGGRFSLLKVPVLAFALLFFTVLSLITVDDHTTGLVLVYGIVIPLVGVSAQVVRYRRARNEEERQQSRVLLLALGVAALVAIPLMAATNSFGVAKPSKTVDYEVALSRPGLYYFRCDPHPDDMVGTVRASPEGPSDVSVSAARSRFDDATLDIASGQRAVIRFTNFDTDLHNVALYRDPAMEEPLFIGKEFSGSSAGVLAFRIFRIVFAVIPIALVVALVRTRLWDMNTFINRTLLYGLLAGFITLLYLAIVVGTGAAIGGRVSVVASIIVTAIVAILFQPLRDTARRVANRLVYGPRATPYEVLSEFSERLGGTYDLEEVIPQLARIVGEGTGAQRAEVWLRVENELVRSSRWPAGGDDERTAVPLRSDGSPPITGFDRVVEVTHGGALLGLIAIVKAPGEEVTPLEDRLLADAASQAGLALRNAQLTAELQTRLDELAASRHRIISAQDAERRRLERDIHDGAQQHLVALAMKLRRAQDLTDRDPAGAKVLLEELQSDTGDALQAVRDLARGIHPPLLTDRGLEAALEAYARRCPIPVSVHARNLSRYPANIEAAIYFCCCEAIQNAIKHARASGVTIDIAERNGELAFAVTDDGIGFDPGSLSGSGLENMGDRLAALKGEISLRSAPERGTTVTGRVPVPST